MDLLLDSLRRDLGVLAILGLDGDWSEATKFAACQNTDGLVNLLLCLIQEPRVLPGLMGMGILTAAHEVTPKRLVQQVSKKERGVIQDKLATIESLELAEKIGRPIYEHAIACGRSKLQVVACAHRLLNEGNQLLAILATFVPSAGVLTTLIANPSATLTSIELPEFVTGQTREDAVFASECATRAALMTALLGIAPLAIGGHFDSERFAEILRSNWCFVRQGRQLIHRLQKSGPLASGGFVDVYGAQGESMHQVAIELLRNTILSAFGRKNFMLSIQAQAAGDDVRVIEQASLSREDIREIARSIMNGEFPSLVVLNGGIRAEAIGRSAKIDESATANKPYRAVDSTRLQKAFKYIVENPGKSGETVAGKIGVSSKTFRASYVPALKRIGIINKNGYRKGQ